ncbi:DUF6801 domain-containing protein [Kitasatospora sp. NPDC002227]|uniref:DUF6801 domain-containing protein n=1 Tax=Kitasatospora sp. NPDC002227 TaxID=3154773 RepID=UPI003333E832
MRDAVGTRRSVRLAVVAAAGLLAGLLPGTDSASGGQPGRLSLGYTCGFPGGSRAVTVELLQSYPSAAAAGSAFRPGPLTVRVPLPAGALPAGAVAVNGTASLAAGISQGAAELGTDWSGLTSSTTPLSGNGDGLIAFTGAVAPVTVAAPGAVSFAAGSLSLDLTVQRAVSPASPAPSGTPTAGAGATLTPHTGTASAGRLAVSCALAPGQAAELGSVEVTAGPSGSATPSAPAPSGSAPSAPAPSGSTLSAPAPGGSPSGSGSAGAPSGTASVSGPPTASGRPSASGSGVRLAPPGKAPAIQVQPAYHSGTDLCPDPPKGELDPARLPPVPEGATVIPSPDMDWPDMPACAFADGFANITKLGQATLVNDPAKSPTMVALNMNRRLVVLWGDTDGYFESDVLGRLNLPTADSTFLTYGFVPTSAKIDFTPVGLLTIVATGNVQWNQPIVFNIYGYQSMRIHDVLVNGTPLDVGPNCRTAAPVELKLQGRQDSYLPGGGDGKPDYTLMGGGPLSQTDLYVPPFTGCASHGENLDALFTAAVSGPGNQLNLMQGPTCTPGSDPATNGCEPEIVVPDPPTRRH